MSPLRVLCRKTLSKNYISLLHKDGSQSHITSLCSANELKHQQEMIQHFRNEELVILWTLWAYGKRYCIMQTENIFVKERLGEGCYQQLNSEVYTD